MIEKITFKKYLKDSGFSNSSIKAVLDNPFKFKVFQKYPQKATDAQIMGSLYHTKILEPENTDSDFVVQPPEIKMRRGIKWEEFKKQMESKGKTVIKQDMADTAEAMLGAFRHPAHSTANRLISTPGQNEVSIFWDDPEYGFRCKARPDKIIQNGMGNMIIDLKTTVSASPDNFPYSVKKYQYDIQAAWYLDGMSVITGEKWDKFFWIAQEKTFPYAIGLFRVSQETLQAAREKISRAKEIYARALETGDWLSYPDEAIEI